jgi:hypothetical protein
MISEVGKWVDGVWYWELAWRRNFFVWEETILRELEEVVGSMVVTEVRDKWVWDPNVVEGFSVKSCYGALDTLLLPNRIFSPLESFALNNIWKGVVPSKVSALVWQVLLDRIPTKENLVRRGILLNEAAGCDLCDGVSETSKHLFLHCRFTAAVWYEVCRWLGLILVIPPEVVMLYGQLMTCGPNKKIRRGYSIVWMAFNWVIWNIGNDRIFNNKVGTVEEAVDSVKRLSWSRVIVCSGD